MQAAASVLDEISDKTSSPQVATHLLTATNHLNIAHNSTEAAISLIDDAMGHCEAAGQESLPASLNNLRHEVLQILHRVQLAHNDVETEQQDAENFAQQADGEEISGN